MVLSLNDALKSFEQNDDADKDDFLKVKTKTKEESVSFLTILKEKQFKCTEKN